MKVAVQPAKKAELSLPTKTAEHKSFSAGASLNDEELLRRRVFTAMAMRSGDGSFLNSEDYKAAIVVAEELLKETPYMAEDLAESQSYPKSLPVLLSQLKEHYLKGGKKDPRGISFDEWNASCSHTEVLLSEIRPQAEELCDYLSAVLFTIFNKGSAAYTAALLVSCTIQILTITQNINPTAGAFSSCVLVLLGVACIPPMDTVRWAMGGRGHREMFFELRRLLPSADNGTDSFHIRATWILALMYMVFLPAIWTFYGYWCSSHGLVDKLAEHIGDVPSARAFLLSPFILALWSALAILRSGCITDPSLKAFKREHFMLLSTHIRSVTFEKQPGSPPSSPPSIQSLAISTQDVHLQLHKLYDKQSGKNLHERKSASCVTAVGGKPLVLFMTFAYCFGPAVWVLMKLSQPNTANVDDAESDSSCSTSYTLIFAVGMNAVINELVFLQGPSVMLMANLFTFDTLLLRVQTLHRLLDPEQASKAGLPYISTVGDESNLSAFRAVLWLHYDFFLDAAKGIVISLGTTLFIGLTAAFVLLLRVGMNRYRIALPELYLLGGVIYVGMSLACTLCVAAQTTDAMRAVFETLRRGEPADGANMLTIAEMERGTTRLTICGLEINSARAGYIAIYLLGAAAVAAVQTLALL
jgi:hypothetical protein